MKTLKIRDKYIGEGRPNTIVPIVATTQEEILAQAAALQSEPLDFIEWRADFFQDVLNCDKLASLLKALRTTLGNTPILVTYRRKAEGGEGFATLNEYYNFCKNIIASGCADLLDVELSVGDALFEQLVTLAHQKDLPVIASCHHFECTPPLQEMVATLCKMQANGADIAKLAVMPTNKTDLLNLLSATAIMSEEHAETPVVTMSMGRIGQASRVCGASFGSAMTFASIGSNSAPGQIALPEMNCMLDALYL